MTQNCPRFCGNCPKMPKGVGAEVTHAEQFTMRELRRYRFANDDPELAQAIVNKDQVRIYTRVTESTAPGIDVGDTSQELVYGEGRGPNGVLKAIRECKGPKKPGKLKRLLGLKLLCGAVKDHPAQLED